MSCKCCWVVLVITLSLQATQVCADSDDVLAEVGSEKITRAELEQFKAAVRRSLSEAAPVQHDSVMLRYLIDKTTLLLEADEQGIAEEPWFGRALERLRKSQVVDLYRHLEVTLAISLTEAEMLAHFKATQRDRALRISGILLPTRVEAEELLEELAAGADFAQLARERSLHDSTREKGGDTGQYLNSEGIRKDLRGIFSLAVGETSEPLPTLYKGATHYIVIKVTDSIPVEMGSVESVVRDELFKMKKAARHKALLDSLLEVYSPRQTDQVQGLAAQFAAEGELDFSTVLDRTLCVYEGGRLTFGDFVSLVPEATLKPEVLSQQSQMEALLANTAIPAHLYLEEVRRRVNGQDNQRVAAKVARKREDLLLSTVRQRGVEETIPQPSIEEAKAYYESRPKQFQTTDEIAIIEILVGSRELAQQLRDKVDAGEDPEELVRIHTIREGGGYHDGRLELRRGSRFPDLYRVAKTMDVGQVVGPLPVKGGFSVFKVLKKRPSETKPFDAESERRAKGYVRIEEVRRGYVEYVRELRQKYGTTIFDERL